MGNSSSSRSSSSSGSSSEEEEDDEEEEEEDGGSNSDVVLRARRVRYKSGLFCRVERVRSDAGNGLVWCAADNGRRIKAFR
jgi:hypothetical protein